MEYSNYPDFPTKGFQNKSHLEILHHRTLMSPYAQHPQIWPLNLLLYGLQSRPPWRVLSVALRNIDESLILAVEINFSLNSSFGSVWFIDSFICWVQERVAAINLLKNVFHFDNVDVQLQTKS